MNVKLLRKVRDQILAEPAQFVMGDFYVNWLDGDADDDVDISREIPYCGAGCIAVQAIAISQGCTPAEVGKIDLWVAGSLAADLLDLPHHNTEFWEPPLFLVEGWPEKFGRAWSRAKTTQQRAKVAAAVIEDYIATDGWKEVV